MLNQKIKIYLSLGLTGSLILVGLTANATYRHIKAETGWVKPVDLGLKVYAIGRCYPSTYREPMDIKKATDDKTTYWEVQASPLDPKKVGFETLHFQTEDSKCAWLNRNKEAIRLTYMPAPVAVALSRQTFEQTLARCQKANLQQKDPAAFCLKDLPRALGGTLEKPEILYSEDVQALTALGINPKKIANVRFARSSADVQ